MAICLDADYDCRIYIVPTHSRSPLHGFNTISDPIEQLLSHAQSQFGQWLNIPGWILLPALILVTALVIDGLRYLVLGRLERRLQQTARRWDDAILYGIRPPLRWWIWTTALMSSLGVIGVHFELGALTGILIRVGALITLLLFAWGGIRLFQRLEQRLVFPPVKSRAKPMDPTSASAISKIVGAILLVTLTLIGLQVLGVSMSSILAMGGFGGLVIGFAARDVIANFFGGMVVHLDKPFLVGDWIRSPDRQIEGIVQDIGWRLTTISTFGGPPLYVPNAWFSQISVETPTRMVSRRLWETVGIRYQDADTVEAITRDIDSYLHDHDDIDQDELITVKLVGFGDYSLDIMVYAFTRETEWQSFQALTQNVLLKVRDIIASHDAELAIPASRVYLPDGIRHEQTPSSHRSATPNADPNAGQAQATGQRRGPLEESGADSDGDA